jgi:predicted nucleic acid-binding protein
VTTGFTFDTGALIALERRSQRAMDLLSDAIGLEIRIRVPAVVIAEWWRGRSKRRDDIYRAMSVEPLGPDVAKLAGEALAAVRGATTVDAIVMASAALSGDVVYTSDVHDLQRLAQYFRGVRVLGV